MSRIFQYPFLHLEAPCFLAVWLPSTRLGFSWLLMACVPLMVPASDSSLKSLEKLLHSGAQLSVVVQEVSTGKFLVKEGESFHTIPASTQKVIPTWLALRQWGPEKTFVTEVGHTGVVEGKVLKGNIVIRGGGDPALGSRFFGKAFTAEALFEKWSEVLKQKGIEKVQGCVVGETGVLSEGELPPHTNWQDIGNYYGGMTSGLSFFDNRYFLQFKGSKNAGQPTRVMGHRPEHIGIHMFYNSVTTGPRGSRDLAYIFGSPLSPVRTVRGAYPAGNETFKIQGSLPHPSWTCAREFQESLKNEGIRFEIHRGSFCREYHDRPPVPGGSTFVSVSPPSGPGDSQSFKGNSQAASVLSSSENTSSSQLKSIWIHHKSPKLRDLIRHTNRVSDNNYAEQFLRLLGTVEGRGSLSDGLEFAEKYLDELKVPRHQFKLKDGSGLSHYNYIAAEAMVKILRDIAGYKHFEVFRASLKGGHAKDNMARYGTGMNGSLWVKTGTLEGVYGLAGYLKGNSGKLYAFYINVSQHRVPRSQLQAGVRELLASLKTAG